MTFTRVAGGIVAMSALTVGLGPGLLGLDPTLAPAAALVLLSLGMWATGALPLALTALLLFVLAMALDVAPPEVIFAGFASSALWLVFGGLVIGNAVQTTGLGRRLARLVVGHLGGSYRRVVYGVAFFSMGLAFLIPAAMGRLMILIPIFLALADELGFTPNGRGRTGLMLTVILGTVVPAFAILPANLPNMVLLGVAETLHGEHVSYADYMLLHLPVLGIAYVVLLAEVIARAYAEAPRERVVVAPEAEEPWSPPERRLLVIVIVALALWATDAIHGISPGWVALAAAALCILPAAGVLDLQTFETSSNFGVFFYVGGVLGMVSLIDASGLATALGAAALAWLPLDPAAPAWSFMALVGLASAVGLVVAHPGVPAVLGPPAPELAEASGMSVVAVLMTQAVGFSTIVLPYQSAPVMVGLQLAHVGLGTASRLMIVLGLATLVVLAPLDFLWWRWLGWVG